jgi:translocation and assembly module TamB
MRGTLALATPTYGGVPFPEIRTDFAYSDRQLTFEGDLRRAEGARLATLRGTLPIDLSLGEEVTDRLLDAPISVDLSGDSIPLGPLGRLTDALTAIDGSARGDVRGRGTWESPRLEGAVDVTLSRVGLAATGVTFSNGIARVRMTGEELVIDSAVIHSGGAIRASGTIGLASLARPILNLRVDAREARVLDNEQGELFASGSLGVVGPLDTLSLNGKVTVNRGVVYLPDPEKLNVINTGDPAILAVVDSVTARELEIAPPSPLLENMEVDMVVAVSRGTWARSREANVEVFGEIEVQRARSTDEIALTGALYTDYGDYTIYGRRFVVQNGSVRFVGDPTINPEIQVMATHEVRQAGRAPFDIRVIVGGRMRQPTISLESQAQPTLTQSDLLAFLAFGQSSSSLLQFQGSALQGGGQSGSSLAGNVAALATRQLASVALGALVDEVKADLTRTTGADVVNIRPADLPADLSLGGFGTLLRGTELQIGKYLDTRTFVVAQIRPTGDIPGAMIERRLGSNLRLRTSFETRYRPQRPTLTTGLRPSTLQVLGALLTWTWSW